MKEIRNRMPDIFTHPLYKAELEVVGDTPDARAMIKSTPLKILTYLRLGESAQDPQYDAGHQADFREQQRILLDERMNPEERGKLPEYIKWRNKQKGARVDDK